MEMTQTVLDKFGIEISDQNTLPHQFRNTRTRNLEHIYRNAAERWEKKPEWAKREANARFDRLVRYCEMKYR